MPSPAAAPAEADEWISAAETQRILSIGYIALRGLISSGRVSMRHVPGARPRFLRSEIEALARRSTRIARPEVEVLTRD